MVVCRKISEANKGHHPVSVYAKQRASETRANKALSFEHKLRLRNAALTDADRQVLCERAVTARRASQYTIDGAHVCTYAQLQHVAVAAGSSVVAIRNACKGKWKTAGGVGWKYDD